MKNFIAFGAAIFVPTCLITLWYLYGQFSTFKPDDPYIWIRTQNFSLICLAITSAHVIVLGIPAYIFLHWSNAIRWWTTILSGFALGALPIAIFSWPLRYEGLTSIEDGVQTMINGVPTMAGWIQYFSGAAFFGACGAAAATAFWLVHRMSPN